MSLSTCRPMMAAIIVLALAACSKAEPPATPANDSGAAADTATAATAMAAGHSALTHADPVGRWTGVEGMYLDIKPGTAPGDYRLAMQWSLDDKGEFDGVARGDTIEFQRGGVRETLRPTDGDATGLKYLAGKKNCLTVKVGEGYCRD